MTEKVKPATDADIQGAEKMAEGGWSSVEDTLALIARIRQEQRRAEAAERVVEAAHALIGAHEEDRQAAIKHCEERLFDIVDAYDAAKVWDFKED